MWKRLIVLTFSASICAGTGQAFADAFDAGAPVVEAPLIITSAPVTDAAPVAADVVEAEPTITTEADVIEAVGKTVADARAGDWRHFASGLLALVMFALAKYRGKISWFEGDRGGAILVGVLGLGGGFASAIASDGPLDWRLFVGSMGVTWTAVGGVHWVKQVFWPRDKK
jgi:hypothetical protein